MADTTEAPVSRNEFEDFKTWLKNKLASHGIHVGSDQTPQDALTGAALPKTSSDPVLLSQAAQGGHGVIDGAGRTDPNLKLEPNPNPIIDEGQEEEAQKPLAQVAAETAAGSTTQINGITAQVKPADQASANGLEKKPENAPETPNTQETQIHTGRPRFQVAPGGYGGWDAWDGDKLLGNYPTQAEADAEVAKTKGQ